MTDVRLLVSSATKPKARSRLRIIIPDPGHDGELPVTTLTVSKFSLVQPEQELAAADHDWRLWLLR